MTHNLGIGIKRSHHLEPELLQARIVEQCATQLAGAKEKCLVHAGEAQEILEHLEQIINIVAHTCATHNVHTREILCYLRCHNACLL